MKYAYKQMLGVAMLTVCFLLFAKPQARAQQYYDGPNNYQNYDNGGGVSYQTFYDELSPYGQWVDEPQYGYVFVPEVAPDFRPYYTNGYWAMTDYGNTWVSSYPWGWACFHYGRWTYDGYYGWVWIPGTTWGPAWVSWRGNDSYYGWAPLGPGFEMGMTFGNYYCPDDWWVFIPPMYLYDHHYYHYWNGPRDNHTIIYNTTVVNNTYVNGGRTYYTGPRASEVQQITHQPVQVMHLNSVATPGRTRVKAGAVNMYRPTTVTEVRNNGSRPTPPQPVRATQPINTQPQPVNNNNGHRPSQFQNEVHGGNVQPAPVQNENPGRYGWDVNRNQPQTVHPVQQSEPQVTRPQQAQPAPRPQPQPQVTRPQQQPQQMNRPQPQPQPMSRPSAPPMQSRPMQSAPVHSAPANNNGGGRR